MNYFETGVVSEKDPSPELDISPHPTTFHPDGESVLSGEHSSSGSPLSQSIDPYKAAIRIVAGLFVIALLFVASIYYGVIHP